MANAKALPKLEALPASLAQTLPSDAAFDALKMILLGAPLNEVLTTITRLIEAHSTGMLCSIFLLDEDGQHLRCGPEMGEVQRLGSTEWTAGRLVNSYPVARRQSAGTFGMYYPEVRQPGPGEIQLIHYASRIA